MATDNKEITQTCHTSNVQTLPVVSWHNLAFHEWKRLGFDATKILRAPPSSIILRTKPPLFQEVSGEDPTFIITGEIYQVDEETAKKISAKAFWIYILGLLLFTAMLQAVRFSHGIVAGIVFIILYFVLEVSVPFLLRSSAGSSRQNEVKIPWRSLLMVGLIERRNTLLISWKDDSSTLGVSLNLNKETALELLKRIQSSPSATCETKLL